MSWRRFNMFPRFVAYCPVGLCRAKSTAHYADVAARGLCRHVQGQHPGQAITFEQAALLTQPIKDAVDTKGKA